jgi:hypothetical protein
MLKCTGISSFFVTFILCDLFGGKKPSLPPPYPQHLADGLPDHPPSLRRPDGFLPENRFRTWAPIQRPELEFLKSLWGLGTEEEEDYRTGPPGYTGWRNSFLGIDSEAPYTFQNTGSGSILAWIVILAQTQLQKSSY